MSTFRRLKNLIDLKQIPEPETRFWDSYLSNLSRRIDLEPVPLFLRFRPVPLISVALTTLIGISVITTLTINKPHFLELKSVPRTQIIEELGELDDLITGNFVSEDIVKGFLPKDTLYYIIGGDYNEVL